MMWDVQCTWSSRGPESQSSPMGHVVHVPVRHALRFLHTVGDARVFAVSDNHTKSALNYSQSKGLHDDANMSIHPIRQYYTNDNSALSYSFIKRESNGLHDAVFLRSLCFGQGGSYPPANSFILHPRRNSIPPNFRSRWLFVPAVPLMRARSPQCPEGCCGDGSDRPEGNESPRACYAAARLPSTSSSGNIGALSHWYFPKIPAKGLPENVTFCGLRESLVVVYKGEPQLFGPLLN